MSGTLEPMYTVDTLAAHWHVQPETIRRRIRKGSLRAIQQEGRRYLIPQSAVDEYETKWAVAEGDDNEGEPLLRAAGE